VVELEKFSINTLIFILFKLNIDPLITLTRGCLRFYGDDTTALYVAHPHKNKLGLDDDGILKLLAPETVVMHDHNKVNYNKAYSFSNIECNVHLLRDLQKVTDKLKHRWSVDLKELLKNTNTERRKAIENGEEAFNDDYIITWKPVTVMESMKWKHS